jgi:hypothetical protein
VTNRQIGPGFWADRNFRRTQPYNEGVGRFILFAALTAVACETHGEQTAKKVEHPMAWRELGSWSGYGSRQTESFTSDTGALRIRWEATDTTHSPSRPALFRLTAHSAVSGRLLQQVVDHTGPGSGLDYVQQDPHLFYMIVESNDVNWKFTVDEAIGYR